MIVNVDDNVVVIIVCNLEITCPHDHPVYIKLSNVNEGEQ